MFPCLCTMLLNISVTMATNTTLLYYKNKKQNFRFQLKNYLDVVLMTFKAYICRKKINISHLGIYNNMHYF